MFFQKKNKLMKLCWKEYVTLQPISGIDESREVNSMLK